MFDRKGHRQHLLERRAAIRAAAVRPLAAEHDEAPALLHEFAISLQPFRPDRARIEIRDDGQFDVVWQTKGLVPGAAWSPYLPGSRDLVADWVDLKCGNFNKVTKKCGG